MFRVLFLAVITVMMTSQIAFADWVELNLNDKNGDYHFTANRKLSYNKRTIAGFAVGNNVQTIKISPPSPNSQYAICFVYDEGQPILLNLSKFTASRLPFGPPIIWASWSPKSTHAVLASYYEADMALAVLDINTNKITGVPNMVANELHEKRFDLDSIIWTQPETFKIKVNIHCNPYTDEKKCDDVKRQKVIKSYQFSFDVSSFEVTYKRN